MAKGFIYMKSNEKGSDMGNYLIRKQLPYGKWVTKNNEEYLFNRDHEPIMGWGLDTNTPIPIIANMWIEQIVDDKTDYYYVDSTAPFHEGNEHVLRRCWNILADWYARLDYKN